MINMVKLPTSKSELFLRVAKGHFATSHSHINYYIDVTTQKINVPGEYDFKIYGNAYYDTFGTLTGKLGGSSEPGIVLVSKDVNGNHRIFYFRK